MPCSASMNTNTNSANTNSANMNTNTNMNTNMNTNSPSMRSVMNWESTKQWPKRWLTMQPRPSTNLKPKRWSEQPLPLRFRGATDAPCVDWCHTWYEELLFS